MLTEKISPPSRVSSEGGGEDGGGVSMAPPSHERQRGWWWWWCGWKTWVSSHKRGEPVVWLESSLRLMFQVREARPEKKGRLVME